MNPERDRVPKLWPLNEDVLSSNFVVAREGKRTDNGFDRGSDTDALSLQQAILQRMMNRIDFFVDVNQSLLTNLKLDLSTSTRLQFYVICLESALGRKHCMSPVRGEEGSAKMSTYGDWGRLAKKVVLSFHSLALWFENENCILVFRRGHTGRLAYVPDYHTMSNLRSAQISPILIRNTYQSVITRSSTLAARIPAGSRYGLSSQATDFSSELQTLSKVFHDPFKP